MRAEREVGCCIACALCLITSVGTLTAQAAISPAEAAAMCTKGSLHCSSFATPPGGKYAFPSAVYWIFGVGVKCRFSES